MGNSNDKMDNADRHFTRFGDEYYKGFYQGVYTEWGTCVRTNGDPESFYIDRDYMQSMNRKPTICELAVNRVKHGKNVLYNSILSVVAIPYDVAMIPYRGIHYIFGMYKPHPCEVVF